MQIALKFTGDGLPKFERAVEALGSEAKARSAYRKVINAQGTKLRQDALRIMPDMVGLPRKTINRALGAPVRASNAALRYILTTKGGYISYKYFSPRETRQGVFAKPRNQNTFLPKNFTKGGRFPNRVDIPLGGHVFKNVGGRKIEKQRSDVRIPEEMTRGSMARAFNSASSRMLPAIEAEIKRLTGGAVS
jgi:hypothetical protein